MHVYAFGMFDQSYSKWFDIHKLNTNVIVFAGFYRRENTDIM